MERILLVEPNYKNKYPPIGLMKISTYFKMTGNYVQFHKGLLPQKEVSLFNKVFITTLFTFDFEMCVETIRYYVAILGAANVTVGGIAATIMPELFRAQLPGVRILEGQLTSSDMIGYSDKINIDELDLDYDILWDVSYVYPAEDSYFIYTTRGCPRKCSFCAVKTLEPQFSECTNVYDQIRRVDSNYGIKKQLLIMDNNILYSNHIAATVDMLEKMGFGTKNNTIQKCCNMPYYLQSLWERFRIDKPYAHLLERIKRDFLALNFKRISKSDSEGLEEIINLICKKDDNALIDYLKTNQARIVDFFKRYNYHKIKRYVDFNQGLDARLFSDEKAHCLSRLAIKPCRIAFDSLDTKDEYFKALSAAINNGITYFSNYMLYNHEEKPEDLWNRLYLNVEYCKNCRTKISLFSFPMKYAAIDRIDRNFIGKYWNRKYLRSINVILNVTSGVVAKEEDFFFRAFGRTEAEFIEILNMPDDFIRYRDFFEKCGLIDKWKLLFGKLSDTEKAELTKVLSNITVETEALNMPHSQSLDSVLLYYTIKKNALVKNMSYYLRLLSA